MSDFKIDCDALTDNDWEALANMIGDRVGRFGKVVGVPRGGLRLADKLNDLLWSSNDAILIVDDVLTTGASMEKMRAEILNDTPDREIKGAVVFARGPAPAWVRALFAMTPAPASADAAEAAPEGPATAAGAGEPCTSRICERPGADPMACARAWAGPEAFVPCVCVCHEAGPPAAGPRESSAAGGARDDIAALEDLAARYHSIAHEGLEDGEDYNAGAIALCDTPRCRSALCILATLRAAPRSRSALEAALRAVVTWGDKVAFVSDEGIAALGTARAALAPAPEPRPQDGPTPA